jgi:hypothetical protein
MLPAKPTHTDLVEIPSTDKPSTYVERPLVGYLVAQAIARAGGVLRDPRRYPAATARRQLVSGGRR